MSRQRRKEGSQKPESWHQKPYDYFKSRWSQVSTFSVLGFLAFLLQFAPHVALTPTQSLDPSNPSAINFEIQNLGQLPIYSISLSDKIENKVADETVPSLDPNEKTTLTIAGTNANSPEMANKDMTFEVSYVTYYIPWRRTDLFKFRVRRERDGTFRWLPKAASELIHK